MGIFCCCGAPPEPPTDEAFKAAEVILALSKHDKGQVMKAASKKARLERKAAKKAAKAEKKAAKADMRAAKKGGKGDKKGNGKGAAKDEGDALLDEIDMPETAVEKFDAVFGPAGEVLSTGVLLNNGTLTCVENFKSAAAGLLGGYQVGSLQLDGDAASFEILGTEGDDDVSIAVCKGAADVEVLKGESFGKLSSKPRVQAANAALAELYKAAKDAELAIECDRGLLRFSAASKEEASRGKKYTKAMAAMTEFNRAYVSAKAQTLKAALAGGLSQAVWEVKDKLKEQLKDAFTPKVSCDLGKLVSGELDISISFGDFSPDTLETMPKKLRAAYDALLGEEEGNLGLIPFLKAVAAECAELMTKGQEMIDAGKELVGMGMDELKEAASGLGPMEIMKLPGKLKSNVANSTKLPGILKALLDTIKTLINELMTAINTTRPALLKADSKAAAAA
uniref:Uncharacterized protein n=1 Tax=Prymnesium polylepis TaxID=72548 RepID=A0A7S4JPK6_9EUKA|mmetsp:Transcript_5978/g.13901  ORF Transcript_5978/g.13901 Transcript_5978/m.13901 type:complete len:451 (+) Transcript_5978:83-1435(+)